MTHMKSAYMEQTCGYSSASTNGKIALTKICSGEQIQSHPAPCFHSANHRSFADGCSVTPSGVLILPANESSSCFTWA